MNPLLLYSIISEPFPLQASAEGKPADHATIKIVATNNTGRDVQLQGILVKIPIGEGSTQLSNDAASINVIPPANWDKKDPQYPAGYVIYNLNPQAGYGTLQTNASLDFKFNSIPVNAVTGTVLIELTEGSNNCMPPGCPVQILPVTKFPNGWGQVKFSSTGSIIRYGEGVQLKWDGPASATYSLEYYTTQSGIVRVPKAGEKPFANKGIYPEQPLTLQQTTTFYLHVKQSLVNDAGEATAQVTVTVTDPPPPKINWFRVSPSLIDFSKGAVEVTFTWDVSNAETLEIEGLAKVTGNSYSTKLKQHGRFALRATGRGHIDVETTVVQDYSDFLASNAFHADVHFAGETQDCEPVKYSITTKEDLSFYPDGTGKYAWVIDQTLDWGGGPRPEHYSGGCDFTWTVTGNIITIAGGTNMKLQLTGITLVCQQQNPPLKTFQPRPMPTYQSKPLASGNMLLSEIALPA